MNYKESSVITYKESNIENQLKLCYNSEQINDELKKDYKKIYKRWYDMHYRCYSEKLHERYPSYIGCSVCEEWHDFDDYLDWNRENYYEVVIDGKKCKMDLDKDILYKGNKIYCPAFSIFVPHEINTMFVNGTNNRGEYPIGVSYDKDKKRYRAQVKSKKLGWFKTPEQAFAIYKVEKEKQIKELAKKYKAYIPDKLYQAMLHWKIEITD